MTDPADLSAGARNLLVNCARLKAGERLLIVQERPELGWYDASVCRAIVAEARALGCEPAVHPVGAPGEVVDDTLAAAVARHDCTIYLARIGDQDRFAAAPPGRRAVMVYARDAEMLASLFGRIDHRALLALKNAVNQVLMTATRIEITCERGTEIGGSPPAGQGEGLQDVSISRFPVGVPAPVEAAGFSGRVALAHYLTPTGSQAYEPAAVAIEGTVLAEVTCGRITGFTGGSADVRRVQYHYEFVARRFEIDRTAVHSWHAGIHPACAYAESAAVNPDKWSNTAFQNPRLLHFHTCGDYAPGEICGMVVDATVSIDGVNLWEGGRLVPSRFAPTAACLSDWPELRAAFDDPALQIGL